MFMESFYLGKKLDNRALDNYSVQLEEEDRYEIGLEPNQEFLTAKEVADRFFSEKFARSITL